jgi:hypothetical protein
MNNDETSDRDRNTKDTVLLLSGERNTSSVAAVHQVLSLTKILCKFKVEKVLAYFCDLLHVLVILLPLRHLPVSQMSTFMVSFQRCLHYHFPCRVLSLCVGIHGDIHSITKHIQVQHPQGPVREINDINFIPSVGRKI